MNEFWKDFVKPFYNPEEGEDYWQGVFDKIDALSQKYCQTDVRLQKILIGFEQGIEGVLKIERGR